MTRFVPSTLLSFIVLGTSLAHAHVHINVDADINRKLIIGTYGDDGPGITGSFNPDGLFLIGGVIEEYPLNLAPTVSPHPFAGFLRGAAPTITTDNHGANLTAGSIFNWELLSLTPVPGSGAAAGVAGGWTAGSEFASLPALIAGDSVIVMPLDSHFHGPRFYANQAGLYDLSLRVSGVDGSGQSYITSEPISIRIGAAVLQNESIPEPATAGLAVVALAAVLSRRTRRDGAAEKAHLEGQRA